MKVSIIVPVYNVEKYLPACLDSIRNQRFSDWEAILVDDGATDRSGAICDAYAAEDPRLRVIHKPNGGAASAKNAGLDLAGGEFIAFLDSDDEVDENWLLRLVTAAEEEHADAVEYRFDQVYLTKTVEQKQWSSDAVSFTAEEYLAQYLDDWCNSLFWNKLFRHELIGEIRFRKERRCIDDEFFTYKILSNACRIIRISDVLYHYRQRASSAVSSEKNRRQIADDALEVMGERYRWIEERFPALRKIYIRHDVNILFFFAKFSHTEQTAEKFRATARFCLLQALRLWPDSGTVRNALRLQFITKKDLLEHSAEADGGQPDLSEYFE